MSILVRVLVRNTEYEIRKAKKTKKQKDYLSKAGTFWSIKAVHRLIEDKGINTHLKQ